MNYDVKKYIFLRNKTYYEECWKPGFLLKYTKSLIRLMCENVLEQGLRWYDPNILSKTLNLTLSHRETHDILNY